jgi:hypothetical protein
MSTNASNNINPSPYLRTSRNFPLETQPLAVEINKSYVDIANAVNAKVIGSYTANISTITGERWALSGNQIQQTLRQVYTFTNTTAIDHNIRSFTQISPASYGEYTDGTNYYGLPFLTSVAVAGLISFYVTTTQILFLTGAGAPALTSGMITLEWLSQT